MPAPKNVLLIVVDQWRGLMLPRLGADYLRLPNIDRLCAEGVTFRNHFTQCAPCGPARASLLTGLYMMTHRAVQNTIPLDCALHQPRPRAAARRLRPRARRLHHHYARSAPCRRQRSALLRAGRHMDGLPPRRRLRALQGRLFRLGREPRLQAAGEARGHLAARGGAARRRGGRRRHGAAVAHSAGSSPTPPGSPSAGSPTCAAAPASRGSCISATTGRIRPSSRRRPTMRCTGPRTCRGSVRAASAAGGGAPASAARLLRRTTSARGASSRTARGSPRR